jgi:hypothetical protein
MDVDPVLRTLGEELARDDPRLAALLSGPEVTRHRWRPRSVIAAVLLAPAVVILALLLPPTVAVGVVAMVLAIASPLVVCWMWASGDGTAPHLR